MTRAEVKTRERRAIGELLRLWPEGAQWELVQEDDAEQPDALLRRLDNAEIVGVEITAHVASDLAKADSFADQLAARVEKGLHRAGVERLGVFLSFAGGSGLGLGVGRERQDHVEEIVKFIIEKLPLSVDSLSISREEIRRRGLAAVDGIIMFPHEDCFAIKAGGHAHGEGVGVIQPTIDAKRAKLESYRVGATERASRVAPSCRFGGVWLVVTVFDGSGFSSSVLTRGAEFTLSRREFDRAFLVDFWEGEKRRIVELHREPLRRKAGGA